MCLLSRQQLHNHQRKEMRKKHQSWHEIKICKEESKKKTETKNERVVGIFELSTIVRYPRYLE